MGLLSTDLSKVRRLSLKEVALSTPAEDLVDKIRAEQNKQEPNVFSLGDLANGNKVGYYSPKKEEILTMIERYGNMDRTEAKSYFSTLLQSGSIEVVSTDYYYII